MTGVNGQLVAVLKACLVDGYTATPVSITRSGSTATVTTSAAHGFVTGNSTTISGAVETDYNGTFVVTVVTSLTFTYTVPGTPSTPATGTLLWKKLGAGWTEPYTGTNKAAFKNGGGCQMYLRVNDAGPGAGGAKEARVVGYETMSDVDTGTGLFPTAAQFANGLFCRKSASADATARTYVLYADACTFYLFVLTGDIASTYFGMAFGEFYSLLPSDAYRNVIFARITENSAVSTVENMGYLSLLNAPSNAFVPRGYTGLGTAIDHGRHGDGIKGSSSSLAGTVAFTNPENGGVYSSIIWLSDPTTLPVNNLRGRIRGFRQWLHTLASGTDGETFSGAAELAGKTFIEVKTVCGQVAGAASVAVIETSATLETN